MTISTSDLHQERGSLPLAEKLSLVMICEFINPQRIFEIGTFEGVTTTTLVEHAPEARVFTLDLDPTAKARTRFPVEIGGLARMEFGVGSAFEDHPRASQITQLLGDSAVFDFGPFRRTIDLVVIDGNHNYENVLSDSNQAFEMIKPRGTIIWDDYFSGSLGVVRALNELGRVHRIHQLEGTRLAIFSPYAQ